jgi:hypothetical protein
MNCKSSFSHDGFRNWRHISERQVEHETSAEHITNRSTWNELRARIDNDETIDREI